MPDWINLPNSLTLVRLALVPFVIEAILAGRHLAALALFAVAAVTDILDGAAARRMHLTTPAGAYFDPIADKCLLSGVYLALAASGTVPWWLVILIFGRDLCILAGAVVVMLVTPVRKFPPSVWGKASTFVQICTAVGWMSRDLLRIPVWDTLCLAILWVCAALTVWSGLDYIWKGFCTVRAH